MKSLKIEFALISGLLGLMAGPIIAALVDMLIIAVLWGVVFGDVWPDYINTLRLLLSLLIIIGFIIIPAGFCYLYGKRIDLLEETLQQRHKKRFYRFAGLIFIIFIMIWGLIVYRKIQEKRFIKKIEAMNEQVKLQKMRDGQLLLQKTRSWQPPK